MITIEVKPITAIEKGFKRKGELYTRVHPISRTPQIILCTRDEDKDQDDPRAFSGTCLTDHESEDVGDHSGGWMSDLFQPYTGSITLNQTL